MSNELTLELTREAESVRAAQALRHRVFVEEMGAAAGDVLGQETDAFDADSDHLVLRDRGRPELGVVATLRVGMGVAYTAQEFDLGLLERSGRRLAEAGRACLHPDYRGGLAGVMLFRGLIGVLRERGVELAVGTASFPEAEVAPHLPALRRLQQEFQAPEALCPTARGAGAVEIEGTAPRAAMAGVPALIKTYLRAGAWVGRGAYVDRAFNTVDVCMVLDLARVRLPERFA
ncbi:GNAT family N-acetyltransferase [Jannaschia marina]|uniref:GNAT family N-acetyltransferase n=1 Tax=Jannaschia marina TaxID=2741674 RepID=UPI0015C9F941|nr:GNAT family N-acetyltransferase [Jannaschia marina]